jgi:hypothetical protein
MQYVSQIGRCVRVIGICSSTRRPPNVHNTAMGGRGREETRCRGRRGRTPPTEALPPALPAPSRRVSTTRASTLAIPSSARFGDLMIPPTLGTICRSWCITFSAKHQSASATAFSVLAPARPHASRHDSGAYQCFIVSCLPRAQYKQSLVPPCQDDQRGALHARAPSLLAGLSDSPFVPVLANGVLSLPISIVASSDEIMPYIVRHARLGLHIPPAIWGVARMKPP